jgi:hypothetical protein
MPLPPSYTARADALRRKGTVPHDSHVDESVAGKVDTRLEGCGSCVPVVVVLILCSEGGRKVVVGRWRRGIRGGIEL